MSMLNKFKENKKVMEIKMEQASKLADAAAEEFIDSIKSLVKDASEEEFKEFIQADDDAIELEDKLAVITAHAECHGGDIGGIAIIGIRK